jgi:hypothetical protein
MVNWLISDVFSYLVKIIMANTERAVAALPFEEFPRIDFMRN